MPDQSQPDQRKRLNYFFGEFLVAEDFVQEQFYFRERMRLHNQKLHTPGVLDGLMVVANPGDSSVHVTSGIALDSQGRLILLNEDRDLSLADLMADLTSSTTDNTTITLAISYREGPSDFANLGDVNTAKRFLEQGVVRLYQEGDVKLEEITVTVLDKKIVSSTPIATAAGAVIGDSARLFSLYLRNANISLESWPKLTSSGPKHADLTGDLSISGDLSAASVSKGNLGPAILGYSFQLVKGGSVNFEPANPDKFDWYILLKENVPKEQVVPYFPLVTSIESVVSPGDPPQISLAIYYQPAPEAGKVSIYLHLNNSGGQFESVSYEVREFKP